VYGDRARPARRSQVAGARLKLQVAGAGARLELEPRKLQVLDLSCRLQVLDLNLNPDVGDEGVHQLAVNSFSCLSSLQTLRCAGTLNPQPSTLNPKPETGICAHGLWSCCFAVGV
jgi:hypothetical protein